MTAPVPEHVHDLVGVGVGPFGLGLAALADPLDDVDAVFLDAADGFRWHPGAMLEGATIQVPFLADLVTMADPTSRFSFLAWLKATGRLYPFFVRESFFPYRAEYDAYCRWVAGQLDTLRWGRRVTAVTEVGDGTLLVHAERVVPGAGAAGADTVGSDAADADAPVAAPVLETFRTRHLVVATGTAPHLPGPLVRLLDEAVPDTPDAVGDGPDARAPGTAPLVVHSADYLPAREHLRAADSVTVLGSGQSAAEIYRDLLDGTRPAGAARASGRRLDWVTRSPRFFPMEYTKLTLELTSPEHTDHFHALEPGLRARLGREQRALYKGISGDLVDEIHEELYRRTLDGPLDTTLLSATELVDAHLDDAGGIVLVLRHQQLGTTVERRTDAVVAATGYRARPATFLAPLGTTIDRDAEGRLEPARDYTVDGGRGRVFVAGTEDRTHGVTGPDLGFGPWRASVVLAAVTGREPYPIERRVAFQTFGLTGQPVPAPDGGSDGAAGGGAAGGGTTSGGGASRDGAPGSGAAGGGAVTPAVARVPEAVVGR